MPGDLRREGFFERLRALNGRLDEAQAAHPFPYNLVTGLLIGGILVLIGFAWPVLPGYAISWAAVRTWLWRDGGVLRRQYEARKVRVLHHEEERRQRRGY